MATTPADVKAAIVAMDAAMGDEFTAIGCPPGMKSVQGMTICCSTGLQFSIFVEFGVAREWRKTFDSSSEIDPTSDPAACHAPVVCVKRVLSCETIGACTFTFTEPFCVPEDTLTEVPAWPPPCPTTPHYFRSCFASDRPDSCLGSGCD